MRSRTNLPLLRAGCGDQRGPGDRFGPLLSRTLLAETDQAIHLLCMASLVTGGQIHVRVAGDRVVLSGRAVTVMRGTMLA